MLKTLKNHEKKKLVKMFLKCAFRKEYMEYIFILVYWKQSKVYLMIFLPYFYIWETKKEEYTSLIWIFIEKQQKKNDSRSKEQKMKMKRKHFKF